MKARPKKARTALTITAVCAALVMPALGGCSLVGSDDDVDRADRVVLIAHDSFALPDDVLESFEEESGYDLQIRQFGDAGSLTNQLVNTVDEPLGDVAFGVDNTFGSRALEAGVFAPGDVAARPRGVDRFDLAGDDEGRLTPVDTGSVCVNLDTDWFADHDLPLPSGLSDLTSRAYRGLFVVPNPVKSSPGLAFLLATIGEFGDGWQDYWRALLANDTLVAGDWEEAYQVDFTQGGGKGKRPIVLSYDSSPAFTVDGDRTTTVAVPSTCFRQVEYAGVLSGAKNPDGARELVDFLLSDAVQSALPDSMYVYPVVDGVELPAEWAKFAPRSDRAIDLAPSEIAEHRSEWLQEWNDLLSQS